MEPSPAMIDDALRFMRVPLEGRDETLVALVRETFDRLEPSVRPRTVWGRFPMTLTEEGVNVAGAEIESADLAKVMARSSECYLLAVTLGPEVDRQILLAQRRDMLRGLALDACASVRADALCDQVEGEIIADLAEGEYLTLRFSPGYGDAPLSASHEVITLLNATRRIGLSMTRSQMMTPVKSITALIGVSPQREDRARGCGQCANRDSCAYRRRGERCGI